MTQNFEHSRQNSRQKNNCVAQQDSLLRYSFGSQAQKQISHFFEQQFSEQNKNYRNSDPTLLNRQKIVSFQRTGDLIRKLKKGIGSQQLFKKQQEQETAVDGNESLQNDSKIQIQNCNYFQLNQAVICEYEKNIEMLQNEIQQLKREKNDHLKQSQKERNFYMFQLYAKEVIIEKYETENEKLRGLLEKKNKLEQNMNEKIRLLEKENSQLGQRLQKLGRQPYLSSNFNINPIQEETEETHPNSFEKGSEKENLMSMSADNGFVCLQKSSGQELNCQMAKMIYQKQTEKHKREIALLKEYYEGKIRLIRGSLSPQKKAKQRKSLSILEQYNYPDNLSYQSHTYYQPQTLKNVIKEKWTNKSHLNSKQSTARKNDQDCDSHFTTRHFFYLDSHEKRLGKEVLEESFEIKETHMTQDQCCHCDNQGEKLQENVFKRSMKQVGAKQGILIGFFLGSAAAILIKKVIN